MKTLKVIDFFCSGGGMSLGMQKAGLKIVAGIDNDISCKETYETNIKGAKFLHKDIFGLKPEELEGLFPNIKRNDNNLVLIGCTPCQYWSNIRTDKSKSKSTKNLLVEFQRFVEYFNPGYVIVENVPGIYKNMTKSKLSNFIKKLEEKNFAVNANIHNVSEYGVPQSRKRFTLIASRLTDKIVLPKKVKKIPVLKNVIGVRNGFPKVNAGHRDKSKFMHTVAGLSELNLRRIQQVKKNGGTRFDFSSDKDLQLNCFKGKDKSFTDTYGRMSWEKISPTITTKFFNVTSGKFVHPEEDRAISLREGASIQTFPKSFIFKTSSISTTARIIGNAVPPKYAKAIGKSLYLIHESN